MSLRIPFHRTAAVVTAALIGLAGAVAAAAPASAHTGGLTAAAECTDTAWNATWNLTTADTGDHEGVLSDVRVDLGYEIPPSHLGGKPKLAQLRDGGTITGDTTISDTLALTPFVVSATLTLTVTWQAGDDTHVKTLHAQAKVPTNCTWPTRGEPSTLSASSDCTTMTIKLVNPTSAAEDVAVRLKTSGGENRRLAAKPGETKTETFSATVGFTVGVTSDSGPQPPGGAQPYQLAYEQPENCSSTNDSGAAADEESENGGAGAGSGDGGGLPVTGAAAGAVAGIAATLLTIGVVLFAVARRRRVTFTA